MKKSCYFILVFLLSTLISYSQGKIQKINIWYFDVMSNNQKGTILFFKEKLLGKNVNNKYQISLNNVYTNDQLIVRDTKDTFYLPKEIINNDIKVNDIIKNLIDRNPSNTITYNEDVRDQFGVGKRVYNLPELAKIIKKTKKGDIDVIWCNGFVPSRNSSEYLENLLNKCKQNNDISSFIVSIIKPYNYAQLRPNDDGFYKVEFKKIDFFNTYELEIITKNEGYEIFKDFFELSQKSEYRNNDYFIKSEGEKCIIYINEKILSRECYKKKYKIINEEDLKKACGECMDECLYQNYFNLRIRGVKDNFYKNEIWTNQILFQFQCNRK